MASHLTTGRINLGILHDAARRELLECLDRCAGTKAVVWDELLTGPFGLISEYALLKDHEVLKMFRLKPGNLPVTSGVQSIVFLTRPKLQLVEIIADNVRRAEAQGGPRKEFHIFFVPRKSLLCEQRLKELGVFGTFSLVDECCIELFPFDNDIISMEMGTAFKSTVHCEEDCSTLENLLSLGPMSGICQLKRNLASLEGPVEIWECHLENDMTSMFHVAKALVMIQSLYGIIPSVCGKGQCAKHVYDLMLRMRREMAGSEAQLTPQIDTLLLIDRSVDMLSPLVTQLTYEGLIDEIFGIDNTNVKLPPEKFAQQNDSGPQELPTEPKNFILNSSESLYAEIRDKHFNAVGPILSKKAKLVTAQFEERHSAKTVGEMKQFVNKLPQLQSLRQSLSVHTNIGQLIKDVVITEKFREAQIVEQEFVNYYETDKVHSYIEDCIAREESLIKILRLVCMQSMCNSGLKPKVLDYYKREILQTYGYQHILTLENLEKVGLLRSSGSKVYPSIRKTLRTTVEEVNEQNPRDVAYVHSGYAPLSVRLAQYLCRPGWRSIADILAMLPGPMLEETQQMPMGLRKRRGSGSSIQSSTEEQKVTLVFFLGGCTYAEIAALRFLSQMEDAPTEYVIATTQLINGTSFIKSLMEPVKFSAR